MNRIHRRLFFPPFPHSFGKKKVLCLLPVSIRTCIKVPHQWTGSARLRTGYCCLIGAKLKGNPTPVLYVSGHLPISVASPQPLSCVHRWTVLSSLRACLQVTFSANTSDMFLFRNAEIGDAVHALDYTEPQGGIFQFAAVGMKRERQKMLLFFFFWSECNESRKQVHHQVVRRFSEELMLRGKPGRTQRKRKGSSVRWRFLSLVLCGVWALSH